MPFSSQNDPVDVARAQAALDAAWNEIKGGIAEKDSERERTQLTYIITSMALVALDEADLVGRALEKYRQAAGGKP